MEIPVLIDGSIRRMGPMRLYVAGGDDLFFTQMDGRTWYLWMSECENETGG
jgi:hypothetical protein